MNRLNEAQGNVDKLYALFDKAKSAVEKAANAVLDVTDTLDDILVEATAIGGKIEEIVPSHIESIISNLTNIADTDLNQIIDGGQSSLNSLKELVGSIPYRDLRPETKEERVAKISMKPDLSGGPQSAVVNNRQQESTMSVLSMESLRESGLGFGELANGDDDDTEFGELGSYMKGYSSPVETMNFINQRDLIVNDDSFEDGFAEEPSGTLSMDAINYSKGIQPDESIDGLDFSTLDTSLENL